MAMPSTNARRPGERIDALRTTRNPTQRRTDLCLVFVRELDGEFLFEVGGVWDSTEKRYTGEKSRLWRIIKVTEAQLDAARWFATWLVAYRAGELRERVCMLGGERRGGKTFLATLIVIALAIETPRSATYLVSPTIERREEIDKLFREWIPTSWARPKGAPEFKYTFINGSTVRNLSGSVPGILKRGGALALLLNEPQEMPAKTAGFAVPAIIDKGGLALLAANAPLSIRGEWTREWRQKLIDGLLNGKYFHIDPSLNPHIDQPARDDVKDFLFAIDPKLAQADAEDAWLPVGDRAYLRWSDTLVRQIPEVGLPDITREYLRKKYGRAFDYIGGVDFQGTPHIAGVIGKVYGTLEEPIYYALDEVLVEKATEDDFLDEVFSREYTPENLLWIGDATSQWLNARHTRGRDSFQIFKSRRWHIEAPQKKRSERGLFSTNPHVADRLGRAMSLMSKQRCLLAGGLVKGHVVPFCPWLAASFSKCPLGESRYATRQPYGRHAHVTDAWTYALYWLEPEPRPKYLGSKTPVVETVPMTRKGFFIP